MGVCFCFDGVASLTQESGFFRSKTDLDRTVLNRNHSSKATISHITYPCRKTTLPPLSSYTHFSQNGHHAGHVSQLLATTSSAVLLTRPRAYIMWSTFTPLRQSSTNGKHGNMKSSAVDLATQCPPYAPPCARPRRKIRCKLYRRWPSTRAAASEASRGTSGTLNGDTRATLQ